MEDLRSVQPFVLTTNELPKYFIRYLGKQTLDEIPCYVFAVKPKKLEGTSVISQARFGWTTRICRSSRAMAAA